MDIGNLDLSEAAWLCLGKLAMAVELECGKRFAFRKAVDEIVGLLETADASVDAEIRRRKGEFLQAISPGVRRLLSGRGILGGSGGMGESGEGPADRYYRGAKVGDSVAAGETAQTREEAGGLRYRGARGGGAGEPASSAPGAGDVPVDEQGRTRIVYRGKVVYV